MRQIRVSSDPSRVPSMPVPPARRSATLHHSPVHSLQRAAGNRATQHAFNMVPTLQRTCACGGPSEATCHCDEETPQPKLFINTPCDPYEIEADQVADHVMRSPAPEGEDAPRLQRVSSGPTTAGVAPPLVHDVLRSPGEPLGAAARAYLEPQFEYDFSPVRLHADELAAKSAASVSARAYTVGHHVVFGKDEYHPETAEGQRLLAHELTHVLQQRAQTGPIVRRKTNSKTTSTVEFHAPPGVCSPAQTREVGPAVATAQRWLRIADTRLTAFVASTGARTPAVQNTARSLLRHFADSTADTARYAQNRIRRIADRLRTDPGAPSPLTVECHGDSDRTCGAASAYVSGSQLVFCSSFFGSDVTERVMGMIHEIAHSLPQATGSLHITDRAYRSERLYGALPPGEALTNAESYAMLVRELATGLVGGTAELDTFEDCPTDWRRALFIALGRAQRWNRDAQVMLRDRRPAMLAQWSALATTHLGGQSAAQLAAAQSVYDQAESRLQARVDFECESGTGGRCATYETYWYALGDFHICPSWRALPTESDRAQSLLAGLYGYFDLVDDGNRRKHLARLARALHFQFWAPPSAADVSTALTATRTGPRPPAAPPPGPPPPL